MNILEEYAKKLLAADSIKVAIGAAISDEQKVRLFEKIKNGPAEFIAWSRTELGRKTISDMVDIFTQGHVKRPSIDVQLEKSHDVT